MAAAFTPHHRGRLRPRHASRAAKSLLCGLRRALPGTPLARMRLLFLVLAAGNTSVVVAQVLATGQPLAPRAAGALAGLALGGYWIAGYRRERFAIAGEPFEAGVLFLLLSVVPGEPFLPLSGLLFRSLYGSFPLAVLRYGLWAGVLLGAHIPRGSAHMHADVARAFGLAAAPGVVQALRAALQWSEASERRLRSLVQNSSDVVTVVSDGLLVRWQAESIRRVLGHDARRMLDTPLLDLVHPADRPALEGYVAEAHGRPTFSRTLTLRVRHADGAYRHLEVVAANRLHDPSVGGIVLNMRDATERLRLEEELRELAAEREHDALHDPLTGLANRRKLFARLNEAIADARALGTSLALILIDLDHFKELNDTLGHHAGDQLLREIRPRLLSVVGDADLVARLGGDEFAVLLPPGQLAGEAEGIAQRLVTAIEQPFHFQGLSLLVQASMGIATFPEHADDVETLMQRADVAMYSAKSRGAGIEAYSADRDRHSKERLALIGQLPTAVAADELVVHYQPKVNLQTGHIAGAEALVRWQHPEHGLLGPAAFLPLAEHIGLMRPLTLHVLDRALAECARWKAEGLSLVVAVNLAAPNLLDLALPADIAILLDRWDISPSALQLEITETVVAADPVRMGEIMTRLRALDITLSLDDFGTGSSSLSYLCTLPVQELKIDKSFILGMAEHKQNAAIVRATIDLARNLGLRTVAEGIETNDALETLAAYGCDEGQGFLLGRPIPADELIARACHEQKTKNARSYDLTAAA